MDLELIKKLDEFNVNSNIGIYISRRIPLENGEFIYSDTVDDFYWNAITGLQVNNKEELDIVWEK